MLLKVLLRPLLDYLPARIHAKTIAWLNPPQFPKIIQIEQTFKCNLKCVMCVHGAENVESVPDMPLELFKRIIDGFKGNSHAKGFDCLGAVELQGIGEPLLHPDTVEMVRYCKERGIITFFISNMTVMTEKIAEALVKAEHDLIMVSVDSIDEEIKQDIRRGVKFNVLQKLLKNIQLIQDVKKRLGSDKPEIRVNSILMKRTLHQIPELVDRLKSLGVSRIQFSDLMTGGFDPNTPFSDGSLVKEQTLLNLPRPEIKKIFDEIMTLDSPECVIEVPPVPKGDEGGRRRADAVLTCDDLWEKPYVCAEGIVTPCCFLPDKNTMPMGDLRENTFEEIWFGETYQNLRRAHLENRHPVECVYCPHLTRTVACRSKFKGGPDQPEMPPTTPVFLGRRSFSNGA